MRMNSQSFQAVSVVVSLLVGRVPVPFAEASIEESVHLQDDQAWSALPTCPVAPPPSTPPVPCRVDDEDEDPERWDGLS